MQLLRHCPPPGPFFIVFSFSLTETFPQTALCCSIHHPHPAIISWCTYLISSVTCFSKRSLLMPAPWEHNQVRSKKKKKKLFMSHKTALRFALDCVGKTETTTSQPDPGTFGLDVSGCECSDGLHLSLGVHGDDAFVSVFLQPYLLCPEVVRCCLGEQTRNSIGSFF